MPLKAKETKYKGYRFRSRLEARWAVFFDVLGVTWEYEIEGYDLGDAGSYLPDFWLPKQKTWVEIKGDMAEERDAWKVIQLARQGEFPVVLATGTPGAETVAIVHKEITPPSATKDRSVWCELFHLCRPTHRVCPKVHVAYVAARSARFEHGEHP